MTDLCNMGMDIGYSNLKIAVRNGDIETKTTIVPVGAAPADLMPNDITGKAASALTVYLDDEKWVAGVEPERLQGWERELHSDYPSTSAYKALFYGALLMSETARVDRLVTGLPVDQFKDVRRRDRLVESLKGHHQITSKRSVEVVDVQVVPQPAGAYVHVINSVADQALIDIIAEGRCVVVDPGFFSCDWIAIAQGEMRYHSSGTSLKAMSILIDVVNKLIADEHGTCPGTDKIENAIRHAKPEILVLGERVALQPYLARASVMVAPTALTPMRKSMREDGLDADAVIIAGGGAEYYEQATRELFPKSHVVVPENPVMSIAKGFCLIGAQ